MQTKFKFLRLWTLVAGLAIVGIPSSLKAYEDEPAEAQGEDVAPLDIEDLPSSAPCRAKGDTCGPKAKKSQVKECCKSLVCHEGRCQRYQENEMPCGKGMPPCMPGLECKDGSCQ